MGQTAAMRPSDASLMGATALGVIGVSSLMFKEFRVVCFDDRFAAIESRLDAVLDQLEDGLPDPAREVVANARGAAKEARAHLRTLTGRAA